MDSEARDDSSVVLLSINNKPVENNNIMETAPFHPIDYEIKPKLDEEKVEPLKIKRPMSRTCCITIIVFIALLIVGIIIAVPLIVRYAGPSPGNGQQQNQTLMSSTTVVTPSSSTPSTSSSTSSSISPTPSLPSSSSPIESSTTHILSTSSSSISTSSSISPSTVSCTVEPSETVSMFSTSSIVSSVSTTSLVFSVSSTTSVISSTVSTGTTPSASVMTTPFPACESGQFQCSDGTCISEENVCDGKPNCPLSEDEAKDCECSESQFRCSSGQCVPLKYRCDRTDHCLDKSDEVNCTECNGFQCASGLCLWSNRMRCNNMVDCADLSDEMNCPVMNGYRRCLNGMQVPSSKWCNGVDDCFDNSDERDCSSSECNPMENKRSCSDNHCIQIEWWCDGHTDCPDGSDETTCAVCQDGFFQCSDYSCVSMSQVCDGRVDCAHGTDEIDCLILQTGGSLDPNSGVVMVKSHDLQLPVCSDNWSLEVADDICRFLGLGLSERSEYITITTAGMIGSDVMGVGDLTTPRAEGQTILAVLDKISDCPSQKVVKLFCHPKVCGERKVDVLSPFIVGGTLSPPGKWPWMVSVSMLGKDLCGGALLGNQWVITAAHCIVTSSDDYSNTPHIFEVMVGTVTRDNILSQHEQRRMVDKIILHHNSSRLVSGITEWDMAMLHLAEPVSFTDYVQPVCVPEQGAEFPDTAQCFLAGWGFINSKQVSVSHLREAKMKLWDKSRCQRNTINGETVVDTDITLCGGYLMGSISACQGDSGGPLMCKDSRGHWTVAGVMSSGSAGCDGEQFNHANRFAKVSSAADWIESFLRNS